MNVSIRSSSIHDDIEQNLLPTKSVGRSHVVGTQVVRDSRQTSLCRSCSIHAASSHVLDHVASACWYLKMKLRSKMESRRYLGSIWTENAVAGKCGSKAVWGIVRTKLFHCIDFESIQFYWHCRLSV